MLWRVALKRRERGVVSMLWETRNNNIKKHVGHDKKSQAHSPDSVLTSTLEIRRAAGGPGKSFCALARVACAVRSKISPTIHPQGEAKIKRQNQDRSAVPDRTTHPEGASVLLQEGGRVVVGQQHVRRAVAHHRRRPCRGVRVGRRSCDQGVVGWLGVGSGSGQREGG